MAEEAVFMGEFNEHLKINEFNTAPQGQATYKPNKEGGFLENQIKEIDDELKRYEINDSNYLGDLGGYPTAQKVMARVETHYAYPVSSESGIRPAI